MFWVKHILEAHTHGTLHAFDDCLYVVLQYMVVYELLLAVAVNTLFFIDGSRFSVVQVGPPCTSPPCAPLPLLPSCCMGTLVSRSLPCTCPYAACVVGQPIGMMSVALTRSWQMLDV